MTNGARRGFTLIEIMVVIGVITLLAIILLPTLSKTYLSVRRQTHLQQLQSFSRAITMYYQDYRHYPELPLYYEDEQAMGAISVLATYDRGLSLGELWCEEDPLPQILTQVQWTPAAESASDFSRMPVPTPTPSMIDSTYNRVYNYYGFVTDTTGLPSPLVSQSAACYFMGDPTRIDQDNGGIPANPVLPDWDNVANHKAWDLGVIKYPHADNNRDVKPMATFRGLWNADAPGDTVVLYCPNHWRSLNAGPAKYVPALRLSGELVLLQPPAPIDRFSYNRIFDHYKMKVGDPPVPYDEKWHPTNRFVTQSMWAERAIEHAPPIGLASPPADWAPRHPRTTQNQAVDWRIDTGSVDISDNNLLGIAPTNPRNMPVVENYRVLFGARDLQNATHWFDTNIPAVQPHDVVMITARARWNYRGLDVANDLNPYTRNAGYGANSAMRYDFWTTDVSVAGLKGYGIARYNDYFDSEGNIFFNAFGDPVSTTQEFIQPSGNYPAGRYPDVVMLDQWRHPTRGKLEIAPLGLLLGSIGDPTTPANRFAVGDRWWGIADRSGSLYLTMNGDVDGYHLAVGWVEAYITIYRCRRPVDVPYDYQNMEPKEET